VFSLTITVLSLIPIHEAPIQHPKVFIYIDMLFIHSVSRLI